MQPGTLLSGKYRLDSVLGRGGMGSVWRAEHLGLNAPVAVKLMDPSLALTADGLERFHREAHAAATIRSPHVVQILDHGLDEPSNTPYIVMELLEGETLGDCLARERTLSPARTTALIVDLCRALTRAHQAGIVHRDLKPDNIFLVRDEREFPKVLDFGVAKSQRLELSSRRGTRPGSLVGTPCYMSPEQIGGAKHVDGRSDLWSLAVITYECLTGRRPFEEDTLGGLLLAICAAPEPSSSTLAALPVGFQSWFTRALSRDPAQRFQTARELGEALYAACIASGAAQLDPHWVGLAPPQTPPPEAEASGDSRASEPLPLGPAVMPSSAFAPNVIGGADWPGPVRSNTLAAQTAVILPKRRRRAPALAVVGALVLLSGVGIWMALAERGVPEAANGPAAVAAGTGALMGSTHTVVRAPVPVAHQQAAPTLEPAPEVSSVAPSPASAPAAPPAGATNQSASKPSSKPRPSARGTRLQDALEGDRGRSSK